MSPSIRTFLAFLAAMPLTIALLALPSQALATEVADGTSDTVTTPQSSAPLAEDGSSPVDVMGYAVEAETVETSPAMVRYVGMGGSKSWLGPIIAPETFEADISVSILDLQNGSIYYSPTTGVRIVAGDKRGRYRELGGHKGPLGLPIADEVAAGAGSTLAKFQGGRIYSSPTTGTHEVYGGILARYLALGAENGILGLPTTGEIAGGRGSRANLFQGGRIYSSPTTGTHEVYGGILARYLALGAENGFLGLPTSGEIAGGRGSRANLFQGGRIYWGPTTGTHEVYGGILARYLALGAENGFLGLPTSGEQPDAGGTRVNLFQGGRIYWSPVHGTHDVHGAILMRYLAEGGPGGRLGPPVSGEEPWTYGRQSRFARGTIVWNAFNGQTAIPTDIDPSWLTHPRTGRPFSQAVQQWAPTVAQVLDDFGLDRRYVRGVLAQINQESGGNPNAVNNNDINWARGYASFGLLQTIAPTYQSFAPPGQRGFITTKWVNGRAQQFVPEMVMPYNNIYAGVNYAKTRYGLSRLEAWTSGYNYAY